MDDGISWNYREFYCITRDCDIERVSGYHGHQEYYVDVPVEHPEGTLRERRAFAKAMIQRAIDNGHRPGRVTGKVFDEDRH